MFPVPFFSLSTVSWIAFSAPLSSARLIFSYCMLFWPLHLVASIPCFSILDPDLVSEFYAEQNLRYPKKLCPWKFSVCLLSRYHYLPMLVIYPEENFVALTHLFCGTRVLVFLLSHKKFSTHSTSNNTQQWSQILVSYRKIWVHFRVLRGKRPVKNPLGSDFQPPESTRCPKPICL